MPPPAKIGGGDCGVGSDKRAGGLPGGSLLLRGMCFSLKCFSFAPGPTSWQSRSVLSLRSSQRHRLWLLLTLLMSNLPFGHSAFGGEPAEYTKQREF
jgi:hypothetical protein